VPALIVRRAVLRGVMFWIGLRLLLLMLRNTESHPLLVGVIIALLAYADLSRRNEEVFLANLGIGLRHAVALYVVPACLLELLPVLS